MAVGGMTDGFVRSNSVHEYDTTVDTLYPRHSFPAFRHLLQVGFASSHFTLRCLDKSRKFREQEAEYVGPSYILARNTARADFFKANLRHWAVPAVACRVVYFVLGLDSSEAQHEGRMLSGWIV